MVSENRNFMFAAFYVVPPGFKCFDNGQKLIIVRFLASFGRNHLLGEIGDQVLSAQIVESQLT